MSAMGYHTQCSRLYVDISLYMHLMGKGERLAKQAATMSPMMAALFTSADIERYRLAKPPPHLRIHRLLPFLPGLLWRTRRAVAVMFGPMFRGARFDANYQQALREFDAWIKRPVEHTRGVRECFVEDLLRAGNITMVSTYPAFMYAYIMGFRIKSLADPGSAEQRALVDMLVGGSDDDMIVQMGLLMYDLAILLPQAEFADLDALKVRIEQRSAPPQFLERWDEFMLRYGCRGPLEMEIANPRYADAPALALRQIATVAAGGSEFDPHDMQRKRVQQRKQAYARLCATLPPRKTKRLKKAYAAYTRYAASREYFKHHLLQVYQRLRAHLLQRADEFVRAGRLDVREQIFELTSADVDDAAADPKMDIRAAVRERGAFARKLKAHVRHFPMAIDSRGRILRPAPKMEAGALVGAAVSPGIARGPIKILHDPFEKEVAPGDVLVAVTTDPGWTPLFIPAAAIILEIGGELQHGALVAREYGKPCVSGIVDVTSRFADGQMVEVDGNAGVVRILD